ncbi:WD40/YVTN/BNR-like repeat-containing protein [Rhizomonospora bruguierae]|uniref:WD40/YVTN/BNR-like repeat-containing protein n=1 Tax=Rhizomonospora bruguierae TaxID=1581705 RepID=UPI00278BD2BE|nr:hypothetical protein [Micromonospora sp. NBRC 107566]
MADTDLDERLARGRAALLDAIEQPPLERVRSRGRALRRRRRTAMAGAAAAVVALGVLTAQPWGGPAPGRPGETPPAVPHVTVYSGSGVTVSGLEIPVAQVPDLPGTAVDAQFPDADHGFVLTGCGCRDGFARTGDGGRTWTRYRLPATDLTQVVAFDDRNLLVTGGQRDYGSADGGATWHPAERLHDRLLNGAGEGEVLRLTPARDRIAVWGRAGVLGSLAHQPEGMTVIWVAPVATATGAWWVGGRTAAGRPAVAVTTDRGRTWTTTPLSGGGATTVQVSTLGSHVYAAVLNGQRQLLAVYHSADGGRRFTRTGPTGAAPRLAGELVPLLDGRLLLTTTGHEWWVSGDDGVTFARTGGDLPSVGRLARTGAGYLAYELFSGDAGWLAASTDGTAWRKLQIR